MIDSNKFATSLEFVALKGEQRLAKFKSN